MTLLGVLVQLICNASDAVHAILLIYVHSIVINMRSMDNLVIRMTECGECEVVFPVQFPVQLGFFYKY